MLGECEGGRDEGVKISACSCKG